MALQGTLKDFGIADILQLIGQQQKTGVLTLIQDREKVAVTFRDGNILCAETTHREHRDLIGAMLVAANLITQAQLDTALDEQRRTLARLGDILVSQGLISAEKFKSMVQLQTSETLFRLFHWKEGTYEFEQKEVEVETPITPLRAESVLMEGFRRIDEWPVVKKRISSMELTFRTLKPLPEPAPSKADDVDAAFDDAFGNAAKPQVSHGDFQSVSDAERTVYALIEPGRTVNRLVELSCLGEFETAKALCNLANLHFIKVDIATQGPHTGSTPQTKWPQIRAAVSSAAMTLLVLAAISIVAAQSFLRWSESDLFPADTDAAGARLVSHQQLSRLTAALAVFRLEKGVFPVQLAELADAKLVSQDDLRLPWRDEYYYRRTEQGSYVLLPPLR